LSGAIIMKPRYETEKTKNLGKLHALQLWDRGTKPKRRKIWKNSSAIMKPRYETEKTKNLGKPKCNHETSYETEKIRVLFSYETVS
jgi:hypothetical protein